MFDVTNNYYNAPQWYIIAAGSYSLGPHEDATITANKIEKYYMLFD
jgi:hypothetical protein